MKKTIGTQGERRLARFGPGCKRGELALIRRIQGGFAGQRGSSVALGIGDDCAILRPPRGHEVVVTTDFTLEGRHFRRDWHSAESAGHRALARGLSDLAAMGARPLAAFLSLALPADMEQDWITCFFNGLGDLAKEFEVPLAGGDTALAPDGSVLADIVLVGSTPVGTALRRSGARAGDLLYCTGRLGGAAAELIDLERLAGQRKRPRRSAGEAIRVAGSHPQLFPEPRVRVGWELRLRGLATAAIDLSDGLSSDLRHLCEASQVAATIELARLPLHPLASARGNGIGLALNGGEDYELLFAARPGTRVPRQIAGVTITRIGELRKAREGAPQVLQIEEDGSSKPLEARGWEHRF